MEPKLLCVKFKFGVSTQVLCSERLDVVQWKARYQQLEEREVRIVVSIGCAPKGERQTWSERRTEQGWPAGLVHLDTDIGHSPRKQVYVALIVSYEHALQRLGVMGPIRVSRNIRKKLLHITAIRIPIADCVEAGEEGAFGKVRLRVSVFSSGISASASNQIARFGIDPSNGLIISRYLRLLKSGHFQLMLQWRSFSQESLGAEPSKRVSGIDTSSPSAEESERYSRVGAGDSSALIVLRISAHSALMLRWRMREMHAWSSFRNV